MEHHAEIAAFGGTFLLMVFLNFFFDDEKETHWFRWIESKLSHLASVPAMSVFIALVAMLIMAANVEESKRLVVTMAGIWGSWFISVCKFSVIYWVVNLKLMNTVMP
jgi:hypothetical protein